MNSKGHFYISLAKSILRIVGLIFTIITLNILYIAWFFLFGELLGIAEEIFDRR